jgi:hypothetical protein
MKVTTNTRGFQVLLAAAYGSYPTPVMNDSSNSQYSYANGDKKRPCLKLPGVAALAAHATPMKSDSRGSSGARRQGRQVQLADQAKLAIPPHATPSARDHKSESATDEFNWTRDSHPRGKPLSYQASQSLGTNTKSCNTETEIAAH